MSGFNAPFRDKPKRVTVSDWNELPKAIRNLDESTKCRFIFDVMTQCLGIIDVSTMQITPDENKIWTDGETKELRSAIHNLGIDWTSSLPISPNTQEGVDNGK